MNEKEKKLVLTNEALLKRIADLKEINDVLWEHNQELERLERFYENLSRTK